MSNASEIKIRRTFVEISEPEDANRRSGSCPPNIMHDEIGTRMAAKALLGACHKKKAESIHGKATGHNEEEALVEGHGDGDKVLTESHDEDRAKALPPFPESRYKGIGCNEAPKLKERKKSSRHNDYYYYEALARRGQKLLDISQSVAAHGLKEAAGAGEDVSSSEDE